MDNEKNTQQHKRLPVARRLEMIQEFRRSGLTRREFAQQYGIAHSTLGYWLKKAKRASRMPAPIVFSEIKFPHSIIPTSDDWAMEFVSRSGLTVRCREALSTGELIRVLTEA